MKSNKLFQLIKSLSQTEKRYFKIFAVRHSANKANNYIKLFGQIEKQKKYKEVDIASCLNIKPKHLTVLKHNLYFILLKCLRLYGTENDPQLIIRNHIDYAKLLVSRNFDQQALKVLQKTKKSVNKNQDLLSLIEILNIEQNVLYRLKGSKASEKVHLQVISSINEYHNLHLYISIHRKVLRFREKTFYAKTEKDRTYISKILEHPMLQKEETTLSPLLRKIYLTIKATIYSIIVNDKECYLHYKKLFHLYHQNPEQIETNTKAYLASLGNYGVFCIRTGETSELLTAFNTLHAFYNENNINKSTLRLITNIINILKIKAFNSQGKYAEAINIIENKSHDFDTELIKYSFFLDAAYSYFRNEQYENAISFNNKIISIQGKHSEILSSSYILNIILHFEFNNFNALPYLTRNTIVFLKKTEQYVLPYEIFLKGINKIIGVQSLSIKKNYTKDIINKLDNIDPIPFKNLFINIKLLKSWLESKIEN